MSSHSIILSSRTVRPCTPRGWSSMDWTAEYNMVNTQRSALVRHTHSRKRGNTRLCKQERKIPTPVRRRLSWTKAIFGRSVPAGWVSMSGMKVRRLVECHFYPSMRHEVRCRFADQVNYHQRHLTWSANFKFTPFRDATGVAGCFYF